jgi:hypothetical protein
MDWLFYGDGHFGGSRDEFLCGFIPVTLVVAAVIVMLRRRGPPAARPWLGAVLLLLFVLICGSSYLVTASLLDGLSRSGG